MWLGGGGGGGGSCLLLLLLLLFLADTGDTETNKFYHMHSLCKNHFLQQLYRKIDGAVLRSQNERNLDCTITFQTHSILQRFMLRFELLQLDCNDHLFIYDGAHFHGSYKADLSCRNTKQSVGAIFTTTNYVTLKYVTDAWGTESNGFKLIITAIKDHQHACKDFRCMLKQFCISPDLVCDEVNHCADGSDEAASTTCPPGHEMGTILGLGMPVFVVLTVGAVLILCVSGAGLVFCLCRRVRGDNNATPRRGHQQQQSPAANSAYPLSMQTHGSNGAASTNYNTKNTMGVGAGPYSGASATLPRQPNSGYYPQQTSATMHRAPAHHRGEDGGPRVSFLPSGNPLLPVAIRRGYCSGPQANLITCPDGSEDLGRTVIYRPTKRTNGSSRG